jgi:hypothetical protein
MISFSNINKQYGKQLLFVDASFQLNPGEKSDWSVPMGRAAALPLSSPRKKPVTRRRVGFLRSFKQLPA